MVAEGYKQTEVGVIPENWDVVTIDDVSSVISGGTPSTTVQAFWNGDINWFTPTEVGLSKYVGSSLRKITQNGLHNSSAKLLPIGTILLTTRAGIGDLAILTQEASTNQGFQSLLVNKKVDNEFFYYLVSTLKKVLLENASGSTFLEISPNKIKKINIPLPPKPEQKAIATALSDVDGLITSLESLVKKKENIKTATMQQLLTGKKRLDGFSDEWKMVNIGQDCTLKARIGWQGLTTSEYKDNGHYFLVTGTDFNNGLVDWDTCHYVDKWRYTQDKNIQLKIGDVLITKDGTIGKVGYVDSLRLPATLNSGVFVIRPKSDEIFPKYLYYIFSSEVFREFLSKLTAGSTITHLYQKDFVYFSFKTPKLLEQKAIATALSDMDSDIETLKTKLQKTKAIKTGMMQELLTGKTRLL